MTPPRRFTQEADHIFHWNLSRAQLFKTALAHAPFPDECSRKRLLVLGLLNRRGQFGELRISQRHSIEETIKTIQSDTLTCHVDEIRDEDWFLIQRP